MFIYHTMKPLETIFWLGTAGVLYLAANHIAKNVVKDVFKGTVKRNDYDHDRCILW
jgi:hypothetical protein